MEKNIEYLLEKMCNPQEEEAYKYADELAEIGGEEVLQRLITLIKSEDKECAFLAARSLSKIENNQEALDPLLEAIHEKDNKNQNGAFVQALEGFDISSKFVDILRIYLFGNFKASTIAKSYLDYTEFDITPRVIKKAEKHWNHFTNNSKQDEAFELKKAEVEEMLSEMKSMFEEE
ncbi:HEAT repeat domain-containing protein [Litoribacter ruber]|uniref:HEAT repeat domain-containing protein n=1 Tax=Litoribacter ruber TaxID=702568 RepID=A0AAP2CMJ9_9BACT|nr:MULTISPECIES: HEAT repeat domain-containing protein [Litoribacter]MBS9524607.1 HEAT repeat domain-containing protein [Litoribacter alkaliphilus]MBT0810235.1 HEAT repeat domain-containing protein [Litoribacter ruber]